MGDIICHGTPSIRPCGHDRSLLAAEIRGKPSRPSGNLMSMTSSHFEHDTAAGSKVPFRYRGLPFPLALRESGRWPFSLRPGGGVPDTGCPAGGQTRP